jgi:dihydroorotase
LLLAYDDTLIADIRGQIATITAHHLYLTEEISHADPLAFCKPIPKTALDRDALIKVASSGDPKFFLWVVNPMIDASY